MSAVVGSLSRKRKSVGVGSHTTRGNDESDGPFCIGIAYVGFTLRGWTVLHLLHWYLEILDLYDSLHTESMSYYGVLVSLAPQEPHVRVERVIITQIRFHPILVFVVDVRVEQTVHEPVK